jgi:hypothetical protein
MVSVPSGFNKETQTRTGLPVVSRTLPSIVPFQTTWKSLSITGGLERTGLTLEQAETEMDIPKGNSRI